MTNSILVFDLGGVLVDLGDPVAEIGLSISADEFWKTWLSSPLVRGFETGQLSRPEFIRQFGSQLGFDDATLFEERLRRWRLPLFEGSEELLNSLFGRVQIALLSNTNEIHWQFVLSQTDVFEKFSRLFLSFETGNAKPSAAAFTDVIEHFGCEPGDIVFLDDSANNVAAAQSAGLKSQMVSGHAEVRRAVEETIA